MRLPRVAQGEALADVTADLSGGQPREQIRGPAFEFRACRDVVEQPGAARSAILKSVIRPEDCPKLTQVPRRFKHCKEPRQVSLPTES